ncbi:hypothetical protein MKX01_006175 [Papaver californicum]|nr:hypothetical protein MKX01_006175 [Papaver californicum]
MWEPKTSRTMHVKSDSEVTSIDASTPPRSPRRPLYYVQSPSQHDVEKMSYGSSPMGSPTNHHYHCSPIHHSRESSTTRFSASLNKNLRNPPTWKKFKTLHGDGDEDEDDDDFNGGYRDSGDVKRFYVVCFVFSFIVLFTVFSLILWGASGAYEPQISIKEVVFHSYGVHSGSDASGVATDMLTLNSTVKILYRNLATFFGVHVSATPLALYQNQLKVASGHMKEFYQSRKSEHKIVTTVFADQRPLYGGLSQLGETEGHPEVQGVIVPLNLTFVVRSRAYVLGRLVKPKFYRIILCSIALKSKELGKPIPNIKTACEYH